MTDTMTSKDRREGHEKAMRRLKPGRPEGELFGGQIHFYLRVKDADAVRRFAYNEGLSITQLCRDIILAHIRRKA